MRGNEFRAWDKEKEVMVYSCKTFPLSRYKFEIDVMYDDGLILTKLVNRANITYDDDGEEGIINEFKKVDAIIMQDTGLEDKRGTRIYEGDILSYRKILYKDCSMKEIEKIYDEALIELINYRPIASIVRPLSKGVKCLGYDNINNECLIIDLQSEELEVIGNIYENPKLLEDR